MPQHKSAKKRLRQSDRKKTVNKAVKSNVSTQLKAIDKLIKDCLLYTSPSPRDATTSRMPSSA